MAVRQNKEHGSSVLVNHDALATIALYGTPDKIKPHWLEVRGVCREIGIRKGKPLSPPAEEVRNLPSIHDVMRWLESVKQHTEACKTDKEKEPHCDCEFLGSLYATLDARIPVAFKTQTIQAE